MKMNHKFVADQLFDERERKRSLKSVTVSTARDLDRAMRLLARGQISYTRWVEVLRAWCAGEDVTKFDFGDAEGPSDKIRAKYAGETVTTSSIAATFALSVTSASHVLTRMAKKGLVERLRRGVWRVLR